MSAPKIKINRVLIEHKVDESPDTSHLGRYTGKRPEGWYVDRDKGELRDEYGDVLATDVPVSCGRNEWEFIVDFQHNGTSEGWSHVSDKELFHAWLRIRYKANGNEQGLRGNLFKYFGVVGWEVAQSRRDKIRCIDAVYCCLSARRLERLNQGDWCYVGVIAKSEVQIGDTLQTIRSGGLWGVESDSDKKYFAEVEQEELDQLKDQLEAIGLGQRAIKYAYRNIERKDL